MKTLTNSILILMGAMLLVFITLELEIPGKYAPFKMTENWYKLLKKDRQGPVKQPNEWFMQQRVWPGDEINLNDLRRARSQAINLRNNNNELDETWEFAGPNNIGGRITGLAVHPDYPDTIFAGAALGGVFKSVDGGETYVPVFEELNSLSTGALAMDPTDPGIVWLGTGEANASGDSYPGLGVYCTEDGGDTWESKGLEDVGTIGKIAIDPTDPDRIFVAAAGILFGTSPERGLYRTEDGGESWEQVLFLNDSTGCIDVSLDPHHPDTLFAAMWERVRRPDQRKVGGFSSGLWRSYDGGETWTELIDDLPQGEEVGRIGVAVAPSNPDVVYAYYVDDPGYFMGIYRSSDNGDSWLETNLEGFQGYQLSASFGWYFGQIVIDPNDENIVFALGVQVLRTITGGLAWSTYFDDAHVDHHAMWINPNDSQHIIDGHDGGVNISYDRGTTSTPFEDLAATQFYAITADPIQPERLYGGTQDNGSMRTPDGSIDNWEEILWGDGFYCQVHPENNDIMLASMQWGWIHISTDGGDTFYGLFQNYEDDRRNWMTPYLLDPNDPDRLYVGTYRILRTNLDDLEAWEFLSPDLTNGEGGQGLTFGTVTTVAVSPADEDVIYAGTDDGNVWVSTDFGGDWSLISNDLPQRWITRVSPHPDSASIVYVSLSGYRTNEFDPQLWRSDNYGETWVDVSGNLPDGPANDIIVDPQATEYLYAGTDFGVLYSDNYGQEWFYLGEGFPSSAVFDLHLVDSERLLIAATHGRSMWKYSLDNLVNNPPTPCSLVEPEDNVRLNPADNENLTLSWTTSYDPDPGDTVNYQVRFDFPATNGDTLVTYENAGDTTMIIQPWDGIFGFTDLTDSLDIDWSVVSISSVDTVESEQTWSFILEPNNYVEDVDPSIPGSFEIVSVYPNPFNAETRIIVSIQQIDNYQVEVYDILGRLSSSLFSGSLETGTHSFVWKPGSATGMYLLRISQNGGKYVERKLLYVK